jgi:hypothetical protein
MWRSTLSIDKARSLAYAKERLIMMQVEGCGPFAGLCDVSKASALGPFAQVLALGP